MRLQGCYVGISAAPSSKHSSTTFFCSESSVVNHCNYMTMFLSRAGCSDQPLCQFTDDTSAEVRGGNEEGRAPGGGQEVGGLLRMDLKISVLCHEPVRLTSIDAACLPACLFARQSPQLHPPSPEPLSYSCNHQVIHKYTMSSLPYVS